MLDFPNHPQQHYYQFQVIIKPSPKNIKQTYLKSLAAIGIDVKNHDIRFVEDDWESPTLGAAGLGWEVWCDGFIEGWKDGRMEGWKDGRMEGRKEGWLEGWLEGWNVGRLEGWLEGWLERWLEGW